MSFLASQTPKLADVADRRKVCGTSLRCEQRTPRSRQATADPGKHNEDATCTSHTESGRYLRGLRRCKRFCGKKIREHVEMKIQPGIIQRGSYRSVH